MTGQSQLSGPPGADPQLPQQVQQASAPTFFKPSFSGEESAVFIAALAGRCENPEAQLPCRTTAGRMLGCGVQGSWVWTPWSVRLAMYEPGGEGSPQRTHALQQLAKRAARSSQRADLCTKRIHAFRQPPPLLRQRPHTTASVFRHVSASSCDFPGSPHSFLARCRPRTHLPAPNQMPTAHRLHVVR